MIGRLNHVAIAVPDLEAAADQYRNALGANVGAPQDEPDHGVTVIFIELPNTKIELLYPLGEDSPINGFLEKNPSGGIHHVCYEVEDILLARAQQEERDRISPQNAALLGAGIGGTAGITLGDVYQRLLPNKNPLKPGMRMAGGLVGAVLGGALGAGSRELMIKQSPAAAMLAKLQTEGDLSVNDQQALQCMLADTYSSTLGM